LFIRFDEIFILKDLFSLKDLQLLKYEGISSKSGISIFVQLAGRLTRLDEEELKICEHIGKLNSKKFELKKK
jgi:hypothetical protein